MHDERYPRLVGDVGGTNARFAWQAGPGEALTDVASLRNDDHGSLLEAIEHYLRRHAQRPRWAAIGIANPVWSDEVRMTNRNWSFSTAGLQRELGLQRLLVINDFAALAMSLPQLQAGDLEAVGGGQAAPGAPKGVVGPGTGLGIAAVVPNPRGGGWIPVPGEGGHATLAAADEQEDAVLSILRRRFSGHASAERALSGPGLVHLHDALRELSRTAATGLPALTPEQVAERGLSGQDPHCAGALELFFAFLGTVAGNLALTLDARGGIYIGGGVVQRLGHAIHRSCFRERFEGKGRFAASMGAIPTWVIRESVAPALAGAARALDEL